MPSPGRPSASLCVLGSGSSGNCSVLLVERSGARDAWLIDAGFGPRRTRRMLADARVARGEIRGVFLTHFDSDHWNPAVLAAIPEHAAFFVGARHWDVAGSRGVPRSRTMILEESVHAPGLAVRSLRLSHDELGVMSLRFEVAGATLGFATDVGRVTSRLTGFFAGVDVMALESNYCPRMQLDSGRPEFLKRRIMGGSGHLSNHQAAEALAAIGPRAHAVLLHLSRECNDPRLVAALHAHARYPVTIAAQHTPTPWIPLAGRPPRHVQESLFEAGAPRDASTVP